jgi:anaerobic ribonucleoside-triphosphate reductase activating protein
MGWEFSSRLYRENFQIIHIKAGDSIMNYHTIMHEDMRNGDGLRVVLFVSGCTHNCPECHNPQTHDPNSGVKFDTDALDEILECLNNDYIDGITFSGGDPLHEFNLDGIKFLASLVRTAYPEKTIWLYTGYTWESIQQNDKRREIVELCDVVVDGPFVKKLLDQKYKWAGSTNQRVIDVKATLSSGEIQLYTS